MKAQGPVILRLEAKAPGERGARLCLAFDRLASGESLLLSTHDDPGALLAGLQAERMGLYEWAPLGPGPDAFWVEVFRREAEPGSLRRLTEAMSWDHRRLDRLQMGCLDALRARDLDQARLCLARLRYGLARHMRFEEQVLFPVFEARTGLPASGPTAVLREEHRTILADLDAWPELKGLDAAAESWRPLPALLESHQRKEEGILYPTTDQLLSAAESDLLVARIQAFPV
jgi:uncharacterized protein (DUF2249 family)